MDDQWRDLYESLGQQAFTQNLTITDQFTDATIKRDARQRVRTLQDVRLQMRTQDASLPYEAVDDIND